jgi:hypothetical protein
MRRAGEAVSSNNAVHFGFSRIAIHRQQCHVASIYDLDSPPPLAPSGSCAPEERRGRGWWPPPSLQQPTSTKVRILLLLQLLKYRHQKINRVIFQTTNHVVVNLELLSPLHSALRYTAQHFRARAHAVHYNALNHMTSEQHHRGGDVNTKGLCNGPICNWLWVFGGWWCVMLVCV